MLNSAFKHVKVINQSLKSHFTSLKVIHTSFNRQVRKLTNDVEVGARRPRVRGRMDMRMVKKSARLSARAAANGGHGNGRPTQGITLKGKPESG